MSRLAELRKLANVRPEWLDRLDRECAAVVKTMTEIHGGKWNVVVNHQVCHVMIVREYDQAAA